MIILHMAPLGGEWLLWAESAWEENAGSIAERGMPHPGCCPVVQTGEYASQAGIRLSSPEQGRYGFVWLPAGKYGPIPSNPQLCLHCLPPSKKQLAPWKLNLLPLSLGDWLPLAVLPGPLCRKTDVLFGEDMNYLFMLLRFAVNLAARGSFLPGLDETEGDIRSHWAPLCLGTDQAIRADWVRRLPAVLRHYGETMTAEPPVRTAESCVREILGGMLDQLVRLAWKRKQRQGQRVDLNDPCAAWLASLGWAQTPVSLGKILLPLIPDVARWSRPLVEEDRIEWRLLLSVEAPLKMGGKWRVRYALYSLRAPDRLIFVCSMWSGMEPFKGATDCENPLLMLLNGLAKAASLVPAVAESLKEPFPEGCELDDRAMAAFISTVSCLKAVGVGVTLPGHCAPDAEGFPLTLEAALVSEAADDDAPLGQEVLLKVKWSLALDGEALTEEETARLKQAETPLIRLRGHWRWLEFEKLQKALAALGKEGAALPALLSGHMNGIAVSTLRGEEALTRLVESLRFGKALEEESVPGGFSGELRPYQKRGYSWIAAITRLGLGACLADDMGLGKTVQALVLLQHRYIQMKRPVLLVCPTSVMENWRREASRFTPELPVLLHHGPQRLRGEAFVDAVREKGLVISSYVLLQREAELYSRVNWDGVILDEAQNIKNPDTRQARSARRLKACWRLALTGTPIENHLGDLWSLMHFLNPGLLGARDSYFRRYVYPARSAEDRSAAHRALRHLVAPFILRRLKTDPDILPDLPEKIESTVYCGLKREQAALYSSVVREMKSALRGSGGIRRKGIVLTALTRLKQICDHPSLVLKDYWGTAHRSAKLERLLELCEEMFQVGDKMIIFTQYVEMGKILQNCLQETFDIEALFLHGGVQREERERMVGRFQSKSAQAPPVFILSLKAGGTGLNLTRGNQVVLYDRWWNPAVEQQAMDRVHRIGQNKKVQAHLFCCRGTLEEKIDALVRAKQQVAGVILNTDRHWVTELDDCELEALVALRQEVVEP